MNISIHNGVVLCGVNDRCWMLETDFNSETGETLLHLVKSFQTVEFGGVEDDPYQKIVKFAPDGSISATSGSDQSIKVWKEAKMLFRIDSGEVFDFSFGPGSRRLFYTTNNALVSYDLEQKTSRELAKPLSRFQFSCVLALRSGLVVVENSADRCKSTLIFRDFEGILARLSLPVRKAVTSVAVDHEESCLAFGCADGSVGLVLLASRKLIFLQYHLHSFAVTSVQVSSIDGKDFLVISGSPDGNIKIKKGPLRTSAPSLLFTILIFVLALLVVYAAYLIQNDPEYVHEVIEHANSLLR
jgi:WD40 repeat protein